MTVRTFLHLDCNAVIPECGYKCGKCIQEIVVTVGNLPGVSSVSVGKRGEVSGIVIYHDPGMVDAVRLMEAFRQLPTFYKGRFVPRAMED